MQYLGGKCRLAKKILPIILKGRKEGQVYVEPFCGGCNSLWLVDEPKLASDNHYYLIEMWKALQQGWDPPSEISKEDYYLIRDYKELCEPELVGFVGFGCSFGGKWFGGYAAPRPEQDYCGGSRNVVLKQLKMLGATEFVHCDYTELSIPENSIVYCDPPYVNTTKYSTGSFDSDMFWSWAESVALAGNQVFVSELTAPKNWECVWTSVRKITTSLDSYDTQLEKLFTYRG